jgi:Bacteriocin-protection, YdeI or OmpD-Associated
MTPQIRHNKESNLFGRVAVVTGGTKGVGRGVGRELAQHGARVFVTQTGKGPGDKIEVVVWKDEAVRIVEVPAQFENLMKKEGLLPVFKKLSYTHRKEYCRWITEAKKEETRLKRLEKAIEMLKKGVSTPG